MITLHGNFTHSHLVQERKIFSFVNEQLVGLNTVQSILRNIDDIELANVFSLNPQLKISWEQLTSFYWQQHIRNLYLPINNLLCAVLSFYWQYEACSLHHSIENPICAVYIPQFLASYVHLDASIKNLLCATTSHILLLRIPFVQFMCVVDKIVTTMVKSFKADILETRKIRMLGREW